MSGKISNGAWRRLPTSSRTLLLSSHPRTRSRFPSSRLYPPISPAGQGCSSLGGVSFTATSIFIFPGGKFIPGWLAAEFKTKAGTRPPAKDAAPKRCGSPSKATISQIPRGPGLIFGPP
ncbi:uncharacterized protein VTP21DRAFT_6970 [Calcarisporiella thermophila]|uniref:uncharacterized protein n=1 Tax=Calcarisporiella thermophila TaxID=911321 RepID=UPI003743B3DB